MSQSIKEEVFIPHSIIGGDLPRWIIFFFFNFFQTIQRVNYGHTTSVALITPVLLLFVEFCLKSLNSFLLLLNYFGKHRYYIH